jgi:hypothetical protein
VTWGPYQTISVFRFNEDTRPLPTLQAFASLVAPSENERTAQEQVDSWHIVRDSSPERFALTKEQALLWHKNGARVASGSYIALEQHVKALRVDSNDTPALRRRHAIALLDQRRAREGACDRPGRASKKVGPGGRVRSSI